MMISNQSWTSFGSPSGASSPSASQQPWPDSPRDTMYFVSEPGPAPVSMENYEQTGELQDGIAAGRCEQLEIVPRLSHRFESKVRRAKREAKDITVKHVMEQQTTRQNEVQMVNLKRQQALLLLSRIYVGSINFDVKEDTIQETFIPFGPIKSCCLAYDNVARKHKGFAFVEFEYPEAALLSVEVMNNALMGGRNIKVGRPSNMSNPAPVIEELIRENNLYNRIYITNVHQQLTETELRSVFEAFGTIVSCTLDPDPRHPDKHRGFGFIEFSSAESAVDAISNMNGFDLGGQLLRVGRSITPPNVTVGVLPTTLPTASALAAAKVTAQLIAQEAQNAANAAAGVGSSSTPPVTPSPSSSSSNSRRSKFGPPVEVPVPPPQIVDPSSPGTASHSNNNPADLFEKAQQEKDILPQNTGSIENESDYIRGKEARRLMMQKLMRSQQSRVLLLRNMVDSSEVDESLEMEINEECSRFGTVGRVVIFEQQIEGTMECEVKIFVEFDQATQAEKASAALNGRYFGGRCVKAELYEQELWDSNDLSR